MSEHSATSKMKKNMKGLTLPGGDIAAPPAAAPTGDHIEYVYSVSKLQMSLLCDSLLRKHGIFKNYILLC